MKKLLWIDMEMTGLDPTKEVILEVAAFRPLDRPGQGWRFGFNLTPGF